MRNIINDIDEYMRHFRESKEYAGSEEGEISVRPQLPLELHQQMARRIKENALLAGSKSILSLPAALFAKWGSFSRSCGSAARLCKQNISNITRAMKVVVEYVHNNNNNMRICEEY